MALCYLFFVSVSVTFHLMFVQVIFSWFSLWPPFGKELLTRLTICSLCILTICNFSYFLFWFSGRDLGSDCPSSWSLPTCYFYKQSICWLCNFTPFTSFFRKDTTILQQLNEPRREKTGFLHMRKQRRRSASR